jgi:peptidoglycan hydrolase-like protein with peptidoglycan-binding domain
MKRDLLEQIIRKVLTEANITVSVEPMAASDIQSMKKLHDTLGITSKLQKETDKFSAADGINIKIRRSGGRLEDPTTKNKSYAISDADLLDYVKTKLDSLAGTYSKMKTAEYVWLVSRDVNVNSAIDKATKSVDLPKKLKDEKIIATYIIRAFYVKTSILGRSVTNTTTGYITTLRGGALVFDSQKINETQWIPKRGVATVDKPTPTQELGYPEREITFGDDKPTSVRSLFSYFQNNLNKIYTPAEYEIIMSTYKTQSVFGEIHKAMVESFQAENNIAVTGAWDAATLNKARELNAETYDFKNTAVLKSKIDSVLAKDRVITNKNEIIVPAGGFKYGITKGDPEFYKVQELMIAWLKDNKVEISKKYGEKFNDWITALNKQANGKYMYRGDYGSSTKVFVGVIQEKLNLGTDNTVVNQAFIDAIKK